MNVKRNCVVLLSSVILAGCGRQEVELAVDPVSAPLVAPVAAKALGNPRLAVDLRRLQALSNALEGLASEMEQLRKAVARKERGHYTSDEHDKIENLLFRYLVCRQSLWEMVDYYREYKIHFETPEDQTRGFIIAFNAALHLAHYSSLIVTTFIDEDVVIDKLNETYHRCDIPRGSYDRLFESVTSIDNIEALQTAWELYRGEMVDPRSALYRVTSDEPEYRKLAVQVAEFHADVETRTRTILEKRSLLLPDVRNRLRHTTIMALAKKAKSKFGDGMYAARGVLFTNVSRLKSPTAVNITFTPGHIERMRKLMRPGDLIMTFSAGYMSNIFLPGKFKHGLTYVGMPSERKATGLGRQGLDGVPESKIKKLREDLELATVPSGKPADLIEAVAEGVIFSSLEDITAQHIARLVVLRPRLTPEDRVRNLTTVFLLLGNIYDFKFDFTDGSAQCCTEVIYRALNTVGPVRFELTRRAGVETLAADDIIEYHLSSKDRPFDFVLLAEEDAGTELHQARILTGEEGAKRLVELMAAAQTDS